MFWKIYRPIVDGQIKLQIQHRKYNKKPNIKTDMACIAYAGKKTSKEGIFVEN